MHDAKGYFVGCALSSLAGQPMPTEDIIAKAFALAEMATVRLQEESDAETQAENDAILKARQEKVRVWKEDEASEAHLTRELNQAEGAQGSGSGNPSEGIDHLDPPEDYAGEGGEAPEGDGRDEGQDEEPAAPEGEGEDAPTGEAELRNQAGEIIEGDAEVPGEAPKDPGSEDETYL